MRTGTMVYLRRVSGKKENWVRILEKGKEQGFISLACN